MTVSSGVVLAVDAGTTGVTVLLVTPEAEVLSRGYAEFAQHFPRPGWVEHAPEEIWQAAQAATRVALDGAPDVVVMAVGITNQRETAVLWDRHTLAAPRRAIVWQDRRTSAICERLEAAGHGARVTELTGLRLDPYFTGTKLAWLREHDTRAWAGVESGTVAVGTVDSYLVARMSGGRAHLTDASNASRTLLYDVQKGGWSAELCDLLGVPLGALPEVVPNWGELARTDPSAFCGIDAPIAGMAGDQQAALFGQACFGVGDAKCTYGTGSFILVNTGETLQRSAAGLLSTVAWQDPEGRLTYALEGAIFVTGAAVQWLRDGLQIIGSADETAAIANTVRDSAGVVFVPALTGLGAPHWDPQARGSIQGITRGTTRAHLVRATLEAITFEVRDVFDTIETPIPVLRVDGGASQNALLMQLQADQLGVPVERPRFTETTGLGAAFLAGLGTGVWSSQDEIAATWALERRFEPGSGMARTGGTSRTGGAGRKGGADGTHGMGGTGGADASGGARKAADTAYRRWLKAVERSKGWEDQPGR